MRKQHVAKGKHWNQKLMFSKHELDFVVEARDEETNVTQTYHEWGLGCGGGRRLWATF